jgi:hypothetical protein
VAVLFAILIALLIVGGMLLSRIMGLFTIIDLFGSFMMEKKIWDLYDEEVEKRLRR